MKVAIIGAGISGLSCALELERNNITPTIFESNNFIGDIENHVTANMHLNNRPIRDWIKYCDEKFNIKLTPLNTINKITHHSYNKTMVVNGNIGYFFERGRGVNNAIGQLHSQLKRPNIIFNEDADYDKLMNHYDYVVIANGQANYTKELGCWQERVSGWIRGAVVLGQFNPNEIIMWLNTKYCNKGYAYLTPFSEKKASISLYVPYTNEHEIDFYWELFLYTENIKYPITEEYRKLHHSGNVYPHTYKNIILVGAAGGSIDPFLGFGHTDSMLQGIYAAQAIANNKNYEDYLGEIVEKTTNILQFRRAFDYANNQDIDRLLTIIGTVGIKQLTYKTPINVFKLGAPIIKKIMKGN